MTHRKLLASILAVALGTAIAQPARAASPTQTLEAFFGGANGILQSADLERGTDAPRQAIRARVNEIFDYQDAAARALGPAWQSRTPAEQAEFVRLFADFLERGYLAFVGTKANVSNGLQVRYLEESVTGDSAAVATTLLTRNGSELDVDYFMARRGEHWMVRDVVVDGMSLIANYRAQFNRILSTSSYADLVAKMQGDTLEVQQAPVTVAAQAAVEAGTPTATPARPVASAPPVAPVPPVVSVPPVVAAPALAEAPTGAPAPTVAVAPTAAEASAAAPQPVTPASPPAVDVPAVIARTVSRQEVQVAARTVEAVAAEVETTRASVPEPPAPVRPASKGTKGVAASHYWIQVGAFRTVGAAVQLAERLRRLGMAALNDPLTSAPGHPAGALARVRVGPLSNHSDALSQLRELIARGYTPFIAQARD